MKRADPQHSQVHDQAGVGQRRTEPGVRSAQGEQIAQLQAMIDRSPQAAQLAQISSTIEASPAMVSQRELFDRIHNSPRQVAQGRFFEAIHDSPLQAAQGKKLERLFGSARPEGAETREPATAQRAAPNGAVLTDIGASRGAHEAPHVAQQAPGGGVPPMQLKEGVPVNDDRGLEHEADVMGARALQGGMESPAATASVGGGVGEGGNQPGTEASPDHGATQLMVALAGGQGTFNKKDFTQLSHLDWAMKISGGPLVDLDQSIAAVGIKDDLHLVQHGDKGKMQHQIDDSKVWKDIPADTIAQLLIDYLPENYAGRIRISSCYSGTPENPSDANSSLVAQVKSKIKASKRADLHEVWIVGWNGPTITNIKLNSDSGTGAETVDDTKVKLAGKLQNALLKGKYAKLKQDWENSVGSDTRSLDALAAAAAQEFSAFYQEFVELCKQNGLLLNYIDSLVIA